MDAYEALLTRRSVRRYLDKPIPADLLDKLLQAAMYAPSAVNKQPWHFVVVDKPGLLSRIPAIHHHAQMAASAPCAILVCCDTELVHGPGYIAQDCAAATQNILLAAHALGLGAVWCGVHSQSDRESGFRELLSLPGSIAPFSLVVLGYPDGHPAHPDRFRRDRLHRNRW